MNVVGLLDNVLVRESVREELVLAALADDDQRALARLLVASLARLRGRLAPVALNDVKRGRQTLAQQALREPVVGAVVQLDYP